MDLPWNDSRTRQFVTNVGLITSDGPLDPNVMAAEWTHHISYAPSLMGVCMDASDATSANIQPGREFGVNLATDGQRVLCSVAAGHSGRHVDKIAALRDLGATFYPARHVNVLMVANAAMNAECTLRDVILLGDHVLFVGGSWISRRIRLYNRWSITPGSTGASANRCRNRLRLCWTTSRRSWHRIRAADAQDVPDRRRRACRL